MKGGKTNLEPERNWKDRLEVGRRFRRRFQGGRLEVGKVQRDVSFINSEDTGEGKVGASKEGKERDPRSSGPSDPS